MSAIFGFTFHIGRTTEVLTPDIYRAHWEACTRHIRYYQKKIKSHALNIAAKIASVNGPLFHE